MDTDTRHRWIATHILPHEEQVRGWLRRHARTLTPPEVDDVIQEAYSRIWAGDFSVVANGRAYFFTVVRNLVLEHARRARIVPMERMGEIDALRIISEEPEPERKVSARQELERLSRVMAELPLQCRRAFELSKVRGLSQRDVAREMGLSEKTVEKHLAKALLRVIEGMREEPAAQSSAARAVSTAPGRDDRDDKGRP